MRGNRWPCPYERSLNATRPGDTNPGSFIRPGDKVIQAWRPQAP